MKELGARLQAVDRQSAEHERRHHIARNAQGQRRDHRGGVVRVVATFGGGDAVRISFTKGFGLVRGILGRVIAEKGRDIAAGTGQDAHTDTDQGGPQPCRDQASQLSLGEWYRLEPQLRR